MGQRARQPPTCAGAAGMRSGKHATTTASTPSGHARATNCPTPARHVETRPWPQWRPRLTSTLAQLRARPHPSVRATLQRNAMTREPCSDGVYASCQLPAAMSPSRHGMAGPLQVARASDASGGHSGSRASGRLPRDLGRALVLAQQRSRLVAEQAINSCSTSAVPSAVQWPNDASKPRAQPIEIERLLVGNARDAPNVPCFRAIQSGASRHDASCLRATRRGVAPLLLPQLCVSCKQYQVHAHLPWDN